LRRETEKRLNKKDNWELMINEEIIEKTVYFVKKKLADSEGGHDWWLIYRVFNLAKHIALMENANIFVF